MNLTRCVVPCVVLGLLASTGCSSRSESGSSSPESWRLTFEYNGSDAKLPLERLDVYLVEDEDTYPEVFELYGPQVTLLGTFPMESHVGYEENWQVLIGKTIAISPQGGAMEERTSFIQLPGGTKAMILGGTLVPEKFAGEMAGVDGDKTLSGTFTLRVMTGAGEEQITGRFAVHCVSWG